MKNGYRKILQKLQTCSVITMWIKHPNKKEYVKNIERL